MCHWYHQNMNYEFNELTQVVKLVTQNVLSVNLHFLFCYCLKGWWWCYLTMSLLLQKLKLTITVIKSNRQSPNQQSNNQTLQLTYFNWPLWSFAYLLLHLFRTFVCWRWRVTTHLCSLISPYCCRFFHC